MPSKLRMDSVNRLTRGECCYVFNSRQMGKSSLRVRTIQKLEQAGVTCGTIDPQTIGTQLDQDQWYASVISSLVESFGLEDRFDLDSWWESKSLLAPVKRLRDFLLQVLLVELEQPIVIFVEEIDSLLNLRFPADDFFLLIRSIYDQRSEQPLYNRLSFALVGVTTPQDLIKGHNHSAFNIGVAIEMSGFQETEVEPLARGLQGKVAEPEAVIREVLRWTGGQPCLTQKLLSLVAIAGGGDGSISEWVGQIVQSKIIHNWQIQDVPQHLKTLEERVLRLDERLRGELLGMYQQVLEQDPPQPPLRRGEQENLNPPFLRGVGGISSGIAADESYEQMLLRLTGLVVQQDGWLIPYNPIYAAIFNTTWASWALNDLRPAFYAVAIQTWQEAAPEQKGGFLLRGQALLDAEAWAQGKRLSDADEEFLNLSREEEKKEMARRLELERQKREAIEESNRLLLEEQKLDEERRTREASQQLEEANRRKRVAVKDSTLLLLEADRRSQSRSILLMVAFIVALFVVMWGSSSVYKANKNIEEKQKEAQDQAAKALLDANQEVQSAQKRADEIAKQADIAKLKASQNERDAAEKLREAEQKVVEANQNLAKVRTEPEKLTQQLQGVQPSMPEMAEKQREAEQRVIEANQNLVEANQNLAKVRTESENLTQQLQGVLRDYAQSTPNNGQVANYFCQPYQGGFATFGRNSEEPKVIINWGNRQDICNTVSSRLQVARDNGHLRFLVKEGNRICGTDSFNSGCKSFLFAADTTTNADEIFKMLMNYRIKPVSGTHIVQ